MVPTAPEVSVVIVCMNRPDNLRPCLRSIREHTSARCEILVVAYRFSEDNLSAVRSEFPEVTFIVNYSVSGFSENN
ncbi:MAG: glycosyltransferase family 2 protein, partial [Bacteroidales bacterium]|nr:glycosyltransferase family 2 protein [Bacteroidales bacterium]